MKLSTSHEAANLLHYSSRIFQLLDSKSSAQGRSIQNSELTYQLLRAMRRRGGEWSLEEGLKECTTYPQDEVLAEIDRLSPTGGLRLMYKEGGIMHSVFLKQHEYPLVHRIARLSTIELRTASLPR